MKCFIQYFLLFQYVVKQSKLNAFEIMYHLLVLTHTM